MEHSNQVITLDLPSDPTYLHADASRLNQIFNNLLNNACKNTTPGGSIRLAAKREGGRAVISVKDHGIGISPWMLPEIFWLFRQVDQNFERSQGGPGVSMTVVKELGELHQGTIKACSDGMGHGSEFIVDLPALGPRPRIRRPSPSESSTKNGPHSGTDEFS